MNIDKISDMIWKIVGISLGILFLIGILAAVIGIGYGIYQYKIHHVEGVSVTPEKNEDGKAGLKVTVQYEMPLLVEGSDFLIIPVTLEKKKQGEETKTSRSELMSMQKSLSEGGYCSRYSGSYYNLVFMNKKSGESRFLLSQKGYIDGVYFPEKRYSEKEAQKKPTFVLLKIATTDTNHDGVINEKDAMAGYVANLNGTKLTQITPEHTQMESWSYDSESQTLFVEVIQDVNKDQKFTRDDPRMLLSVNVLDPKIGQELIPADIKSKVEAILKK